MLYIRDIDIEPGDIIFLISNENDWSTRLKRLIQTFNFFHGKHGHREVLSVFVCSGRSKKGSGLTFHNHERPLTHSTKKMRKYLEDQTLEQSFDTLQKYLELDNTMTASKMKTAFQEGDAWLREFSKTIAEDDKISLIKVRLLTAIAQQKAKAIDVLMSLWQASGGKDTLLEINNSLLVFKLTDHDIRRRFLAAYQSQVQLTEKFHNKKRNRSSMMSLLTSLFKSARQDSKDRNPKQTPAEETYCARNVIEVLNSVDPTLVARGRHVTPKSLEAGMRAATVENNLNCSNPDNVNPSETEDDIEALIAAEETKPRPAFTLQIAPQSGKELMKQLLSAIDKETRRIKNKWIITAFDRKKLANIETCVRPFRNPEFQQHHLKVQVDNALELLVNLLPILRKKRMGFFEHWFPATSYSNIRAFARTQGIFDGDILNATQKMAMSSTTSNASTTTQTQQTNSAPAILVSKTTEPKEDLASPETYIFSDWSFINWSLHKQETIITYMNKLLADGHNIYIMAQGKFVNMNKESIRDGIQEHDIDNLLSEKIRPETNRHILEQAKQQGLSTLHLKILDHAQCQRLYQDDESIEKTLDLAATLYSPRIDTAQLIQTKLDIIDNELENTSDNEIAHAFWMTQKKRVLALHTSVPGGFLSGIDKPPSQTATTTTHYPKPIFKPRGIGVIPPFNYYRREVYTHLLINETPNTHFDYFNLQGMEAKDLASCHYRFHSKSLPASPQGKKYKTSLPPIYEAKITLTLSKNWCALPSLHPEERLTDLYIKELTSSRNIEIKHSNTNRLYYIRLANPSELQKTVDVNYLLEMPSYYQPYPMLNTIRSPQQTDHQEIDNLLIKYLCFNGNAKSLATSVDTPIHNGTAYLEEARRLTTGSCRLRAIAFKEEMMRQHPSVPVNVVVNSYHCFVEIQLNGKWQTYCLGGYRNTNAFTKTAETASLKSLLYSSNCHLFGKKPAKPPKMKLKTMRQRLQ